MQPVTRVEQYLSAIAGNEGTVPEHPITREEMYLAAILERGIGGGGTTDYEALENKPSINGVVLSGNLELADIMADVTQEDVEESVPEADIEQAIENAWNAAFNGGGG